MAKRVKKRETYPYTLEQLDAFRAVLVERWPLVFFVHGANKVPLKIGIHKDIMRELPDVPKSLVRWTLHVYTMKLRYALGVMSDKHRYDLNGVPAGLVNKKDLHNAQCQYVAIMKRMEAYRRRQHKRQKAVESSHEAHDKG